MVSLFLLLGCNLSYIVDLFAALHELASASVRTLLKLASSVRALLKPYGDTLSLAFCRLLEYFFQSHFLKKTALSFFFLLDYASRTCSMPLQRFLYISFAQSRKMLSKFSKLSAILKHRGKSFVMMTSIVHLSSKARVKRRTSHEPKQLGSCEVRRLTQLSSTDFIWSG